MKNLLSNRDKAVLIGLYLSKYDSEGLREFGLDGMVQAFNILGYSIGVKPTSIKNYRDEFDPYFSNPRKGWYKRVMRDYCKKIFDDFSNLNFYDFTELVKSLAIQIMKLKNLSKI